MSEPDVHYLNHTCECPNCFLIWESWEENKTNQLVETIHCEHCSHHLPMTEFDRVDRYISIINKTGLKDLARMLPRIWKIIKEIKEKQNETI